MGWKSLRDKVRYALNQRRFDYAATATAADFDLSKAKHLLICKMDGKLGDTEVISPLIRTLQTLKCPPVLSVICPPEIAPLYAEVLGVEHTFAVKRKPGKAELDALFSGFSALPPVDVMLSTEPNFRWRDFYVLQHFHPVFLAGFDERVKALNLNLKAHCFGQHITAYFETFLKLGGLEISDPSYVRLTTEECLSAMRPYVPEGTIAIAPYGASVHRHLSTPVILGMVRQVTELLHAPVALMVRSEYAALIDEVKAACPDAQIVALPAKLSVMEVAAIIDLSAAMLSVDTANVHLACGSDIPLFAIYSGHDPEGIVRWGPSPYKQDVVIFHEGTKRIEDITPEVITEPLREFLVKLRKPSQA